MKSRSIRITLTEEEKAYIRELLINEDYNNISMQEIIINLLEKIK